MILRLAQHILIVPRTRTSPSLRPREGEGQPSDLEYGVNYLRFLPPFPLSAQPSGLLAVTAVAVFSSRRVRVFAY